MAGQIVMEGFLNFRMPAWLRRLITRSVAIIPAVVVTILYGEQRDGEAADLQPGGPQPAAPLRGRSRWCMFTAQPDQARRSRRAALADRGRGARSRR